MTIFWADSDNGAYYYYYTGKYDSFETAFKAVHDTDQVQRQIPFKYLQVSFSRLTFFWSHHCTEAVLRRLIPIGTSKESTEGSQTGPPPRIPSQTALPTSAQRLAGSACRSVTPPFVLQLSRFLRCPFLCGFERRHTFCVRLL